MTYAMSERPRAETMARAWLTLGALLPYWRLLTFRVIYVTDDYFTSDIFNGELPGRVLIGQLIRHGQLPLWTSQLCSGIPLAGGSAEPIGLAAFALLPPAVALDLLLIVLLLVAAHGAYSLARCFGADRTGGVLAGLAFAGSGYIAVQLKHLGIVSTVVWLPVGLVLLERVLGPSRSPETPAGSNRDPTVPVPTPARRAFMIAAFGLVFAEQVLSGFPQSAYICALTYGSFAVFRAFTNRERMGRLPASLVLLGGLGIVIMMAAAVGAVVLLPLSELGGISDRSQTPGWAWATAFPYWPRNVLTFLVPYINGDISNNTYRGPSLFWEDYGYVGAATFLLAIYGAARERRRSLVRFSAAMTVVAFLFVLGARSRLFHLAYLIVPGMDVFRFPTRFLIVVELGLAVLAGVGLTRLGADLGRRFSAASRVPRLVVLALCVGTALDLWFHQPRQNPMVPARTWLEPPESVHLVQADSVHTRTLTAGYRDLHLRSFALAHGWTNLTPYYELRDLLPPNIGGGYWNTPSADCYAGIAPRWVVDVWGDHNREDSVISRVAHVDFEGRTLQIGPALVNVLRTYGVSHLLSAFAAEGTLLPLAGQRGTAFIYRIPGASRVRFVRGARHIGSDEEAADRLIDPGFDPDREILLHEAPKTVGPTAEGSDRAGDLVTGARTVITHDDSRKLEIEADAPADGFLLLADTYYPGWIATLDGKTVPIYRANLSVRGIQLPKGRHDVTFVYEAPAYSRGLRVSLVALSTLLLCFGVAAYYDRRARAHGSRS